MEKIKISFVSGRAESNSSEAFGVFSTTRIGEQKGEKIIYSLQEALYLFEKKKADVVNSRGKILSRDEVLRNFEKLDKKFWVKYVVFCDLRQKGYIVKTALKFGADFRVYDKDSKLGEDHAKWIAFAVSENEHMTWQDFSSKNRVAHSTNKNLLIAIVDDEDDVSFYEVRWMRN